MLRPAGLKQKKKVAVKRKLYIEYSSDSATSSDPNSDEYREEDREVDFG